MPRDKHPGERAILEWFSYDHLPEGNIQYVSSLFTQLAYTLSNGFSISDPELTMGLRKLLEAKDCFVRVAVKEQRYTQGG